MPNMSYCRFRNTYGDLRDCVDALDEKDADELSRKEQCALRGMLILCRDLTERDDAGEFDCIKAD